MGIFVKIESGQNEYSVPAVSGSEINYEVYLISRIQEEWHHLVRVEGRRSSGVRRAAWRNHQAIVIGQAKSGRIVAAAAMILVFGSFLLGGSKAFGSSALASSFRSWWTP